MKTKLTILILLTAVSFARANLIDLTPGGFSLGDPWPIQVQHYFRNYGHNMTNLAGASVTNGQVEWSPFTIFGDENFDFDPNGPDATVGWDLLGTNFRVRFVLVESEGLIAHLYAVRGLEHYFSMDDFITLDGIIPVYSAIFAGSGGPVPDNGSTVALMGLGMLGLFFFARRVRA